MNEVISRLATRAAGCCMLECLCGKLGAIRATLRYLDVIFVACLSVCLSDVVCMFMRLYVYVNEVVCA